MNLENVGILEVIASVEIAVEHSESGKLYESMTSFGHQKNSAPHHLLEALTPVSYTYGFIDFCWWTQLTCLIYKPAAV